ncbi:derlin-1-like [Corticium candelabrum]|uniref:derlin-1-like n=1 Tax=Corticium candelabrum TaxID=121492 RepID=UPI002E274304|nr:derlin-1-like [Corticium candelabrum]
MAESGISDWFNSIPLVTRAWFGLSIIFPLVGNFGFINPQHLLLWYDAVVYRFQIWRLATCVFFHPLGPGAGFRYLITLYFLYSYSSRLESGIFDGRPADYLFMLLMHWIVVLVIALFMGLPLIMHCVVMAVIYVWCQLHKDTMIVFWFGATFKAMYFPWVLAAFNMIIMGSGLVELIGIFTGHVYFFLMFKYPQDFGGQTFLSTPQIFYKWLPNRRTMGGFGQVPASRRQQDDGNNGRHTWGQGQTLGRNQ